MLFAHPFTILTGASGSGKSTLMHVIGCLDTASAGSYRFAGQDVASLDGDGLARLRRQAFGFVFQGYHLIPTASALQNVELPAVYAGVPRSRREQRARELLARLDLSDRLEHRPAQLSGGQQQRVSIARSLMNGGQVILADEPTGALDSRSGASVMALLGELAAAGHTIVLVTHDREIAAHARRVIELRDGEVVSDSAAQASAAGGGVGRSAADVPDASAAQGAAPWLADLRETVSLAWRVMWANSFRTLLTLLGIVIGVASVIVMLAIGAGTQEKVIARMATFGTHRLYVSPGGDNEHEPGQGLHVADAQEIAGVPNVAVAMPFLSGNAVLRRGSVDVSSAVWCVTADAPRVLNWKVAAGAFFTREDDAQLATVAVLGKRTREKLFPEAGDAGAVGRYVLVNNVPFLVVGELEEKGAVSGDASDDEVVMIPYSTGSRRLFGTVDLSWISVLIDSIDASEETSEAITARLEASRRARDFHVFNHAASVKAQMDTQRNMTRMLGLVAVISLIVGGIGIMNIMLMTVKERTREIGIRIAVGARQRDIQRQFLTEAAIVSLAGGAAGVVAGLAVGLGLLRLDVPLIFSGRAVVGAFACALAVGLVFGFVPARQAARLDPVAALGAD